MSLDLPDVSITSGPEYASKNNTAFEVLDEHDHSSGKGTKVTSAGINVNADFSLNSNNLTNTDEVEFNNLASTTATLRALNVVGGELYYNDAAGNSIRFTNGGALDISASTGIGGDYGTTAAIVNYSDSTLKYSFLDSAADASTIVCGGLDFDASGSNTVTGTPTFTQAITIEDSIVYSTTPDIIGNFNYSGTPNIGGNWSFTGTPTVGGNATMSGNITFSGSNTHSGTNDITGSIDLNNNAAVGESVTLANNIKLHRSATKVLQLVDASTSPADGAVGGTPATLDPTSILDGSITESKIGTGAVTATELASNAVTTVKILNSNVTTDKIANLNVTEGKIASSAVTVNKIGSNAVTTVKILNSNVTTDKIANLNVTEGKIATGAVTAAKIGTNAVTAVKILASNVTEAKIATGAVTVNKIGSNAVTTVKISNANVTRAKLESVGQQVSSSSSNYQMSSGTFTAVTNLSVTITTTGRPVMLMLISDASAGLSGIGNSGGSSYYGFWRGGSQITNTEVDGAGGILGILIPTGSANHLDVVGAGTYTYTFKTRKSSASNSFCFYAKLVAYEL